MALRCPACKHEITPAYVNVAADLARCCECGEIFRASAALGGGSAAPASGEERPPVPDDPPEGTKIEVEEHVGAVALRLPPRGFGADTVFLTAFAIAWWSFLLMFVGVGVMGFARDRDRPAAAPAEKSSEPAAPERKAPAEKEAPRKEGLPVPEKIFPVFILLFLTPFFAAGLAMLGGILWPLFGRVEVSVDGAECSHRASLFGLGRTRRAAVESTRLRWRSEIASAIQAGPAFLRRLARASGASASPVFLSLGTWETRLGAHLSEREQEWVFHVLDRALARARGEEEARPRGPSLS